jgi:hypothetical protein
MTAMVDCRFAALRLLGHTGTTSDMLLAWLKAEGGATSDSVNDAWVEMLTVQGFPLSTYGSVQDAWWALLRSLGYTGSLADMEKDFWCLGGGSLASVWILLSGAWNDAGVWLDGAVWID